MFFECMFCKLEGKVYVSDENNRMHLCCQCAFCKLQGKMYSLQVVLSGTKKREFKDTPIHRVNEFSDICEHTYRIKKCGHKLMAQVATAS